MREAMTVTRFVWITAPLLLCVAWAQQSERVRSSGLDVNGRPLGSYTSEVQGKGSLTRVEKQRSPNGDLVPRREFEERTVSDDGVTRVVERVEKTYSPNGQPLPARRTVITETKRPDGAVATTTATYLNDINGRPQVVEQAQTETRQQGNTTTVVTTVQRPGLSGQLQVAERIEATAVKTGEASSQQTISTQSRDLNGNYRESARQVVDTRVENGVTVENRAVYNTVSGPLTLAEQRVSRTLKQGNVDQVVTDIFTTNGAAFGVADNKLRLTQREIVERQPQGNGGFVETVSVQQPNANTGGLGNPVVQSQNVCTGACVAPAPAPAAAAKK